MRIFISKKKLSTLIMAGMVLTMVFTMAPKNSFAASGVTTARLFGTDRIGTAIAVSKAGWTTADTAILAPSANANLVDALAAAPLAGKTSPILLTEKNTLNTNTKTELIRLGVTKVFVVGAINQTVVDQLNAMGNITATALKGANRTATAAAIAAKLVNPSGSFVVGYGALADALSVASYAAANNYSILVANADGSLPASEAPYKGTNVKIIGGPTLVANIDGATRYYGADRFETNKNVLKAFQYNYDKVYVANGTSSHLVDSLIASSFAAKSGSPIVLGNGSSSAAALYVYGKLATSSIVTALGGSTVVSKEMLEGVAYNAPVLDPQQSTRLNPAPLNTIKSISVNDYIDNYTAQITLKEIIRGDDAWTMIEGANMFNSPPKDGYEYILAKINFELVDIDNGKSLDIYSFDFSLISSEGKEYDYVGEVIPNPQLDASLYKGAVSEGWAVYQVRLDDVTPTLTYGRNYDGTGGVWFKAYN
ncbi:cell wall-binding repeat-containing protein [Clostridium sp. CF012]|uniref:cell wall-binding repeat-containing protein n=1 Tax=Clostridium sp. CF012 TaxID=2843319 RepID=UPI001C0C1CBD|nr:cell wall-binding repeat-containing protein [Clostridium sp. CF012]MBU3146138.1 cell wall-binding repeat-containing protein [Clostridium sp. CF012]